ncbi:hypothetical protein D8I24_2964 (plasmid) [Cupriavidus necator H850]|uniref:hypothetical protein n=1 Tax=Cupriavidus necator TaxID=106590 RepID=UPI00129EF4F7|nr:hypothetical protein [Cupriavidus necator]KAI3603141.1 hypothetical protein D8I24_2964 [Cupriavidus necator H850]
MRAIALATCLLCPGVFAAMPTGADSAVPLAVPEAPAIHHMNGIDYVSGGIGVDQVAAMRSMAERFNVHMHFVNEADGSSLSDVTVTLFDARREILLLVLSEGPLLYLRLPPGNYRVVVSSAEAIESRSLRVRQDGRGPSLLLRLPGDRPYGPTTKLNHGWLESPPVPSIVMNPRLGSHAAIRS